MRQPLEPALLLDETGGKTRGVIKEGGLERILEPRDRGGYVRMAQFMEADALKLGPGLLPPGDPLAHCVCF